MTPDPKTARTVAAELLDRVTRGGAYSNVVVRTGTATLTDVDRRFVQRLLFGSLRHLVRIDRAIAASSQRAPAALEPLLLAALRIGTEELLFMHTPAHAAVDGAVTAARELGAARGAGYVNAVLRAISRRGEPPYGPGEDVAAALGVPGWLFAQLAGSLGDDGARAFLEASNADAPIGVRQRGEEAAPGEPFPGIAGARVGGHGPAVAEAVRRAVAAVADPASVAVGNAVGAAPGMVIADLAAAPGGKTMHLLDMIGGDGVLVAADRHERRLRAAANRVGPGPHWVVGDARHPPLRGGIFDRVLLDAPCTGLGTLRRRPEIRHRLRPDSALEAGSRQRAMVEAALRLVRPGGRLIYSVCTVLAAETIDVVTGLGAAPPGGLPGVAFGDGLLLAPHLTGTDGMFIAVIAG